MGGRGDGGRECEGGLQTPPPTLKRTGLERGDGGDADIGHALQGRERRERMREGGTERTEREGKTGRREKMGGIERRKREGRTERRESERAARKPPP